MVNGIFVKLTGTQQRFVENDQHVTGYIVVSLATHNNADALLLNTSFQKESHKQPSILSATLYFHGFQIK